MIPNKVLITGSNGQLEENCLCSSRKKESDMPATIYRRSRLQIKSIREVMDAEKPDCIINCAAVTNVDGCEEQRVLAQQVNAEAQVIWRKKRRRAEFRSFRFRQTMFLTATVFAENGSVRPYVETDKIDPQSVYGSTKADGEHKVMSATGQYFIIRTAWLYGDGKLRQNNA